MSFIVVSVSKRILTESDDGDDEAGLLDNNNDDGTTTLTTEGAAIDETISMAMTKLSVITISRLFTFYPMQFRTNRLRPFVSFYLLQTNFHI
jgi:hypothetical protein